MKKLYLHIGLGKTGSSAIQSWLSLNEEALAQQGFDYVGSPPDAKAGKISSGNGVKLARMCAEEQWEQVENLICNVYFNKNSQAIISSETLIWLSAEQLDQLKVISQIHNIEVIIIAYARSVYEHAYSNYLQGVKRGGQTKQFRDLPNLLKLISFSGQLDVLKKYHEKFNNVKILNYDQHKSRIFESFSSAIGFNSAHAQSPSQKVNRSISKIELDILLQCNRLHEGVFSREISDFIIYANPVIETEVYYDREILDKCGLLAKKNVDWVNNNLLSVNQDPLTLVVATNSEEAKHLEQQSSEEVLSLIVDWALGRESTPRGKKFFDFLIRFCDYLQPISKNLSEKITTKITQLAPATGSHNVTLSTEGINISDMKSFKIELAKLRNEVKWNHGKISELRQNNIITRARITQIQTEIETSSVENR